MQFWFQTPDWPFRRANENKRPADCAPHEFLRSLRRIRYALFSVERGQETTGVKRWVDFAFGALLARTVLMVAMTVGVIV